MLFDSEMSPRAKRLWTFFVLLSPLACLAGILIKANTDPHAKAGINVDRQQAIEIAREFVIARGFDIQGWDAYCQIETHGDRYSFFHKRQGSGVELARRLAPVILVRVLLVPGDWKESLRVYLGADGRPYGYVRTLPLDREVADTGEAAARSLAEATFRLRPEAADTARIGTPILKEERTATRVLRRYSWPYTIDSLPEFELQFVVAVLGNMVVTDTIEARIDPKFIAETEGNATLQVFIRFAYGLLLAGVMIFGIYRFLQRARQKEVSYGRVFLLAGFVSAVFLVVLLQSDSTADDAIVRVSAPSRWQVIFFAEVAYLFMGMFLGLAYGAGEGDVREAYPGKLTSLDAVFLGKFSSINVARAVLIGCAFGGWSLLLHSLILVPFDGGGMTAFQGNATLGFLLGRIPWLLPFLLAPMGAILVFVVGLLLPLPFLHRRFRSKRTVLILLFIVAFIAQLGSGVIMHSWSAVLLLALVGTVTILVPFFAFDLLTAIACFGMTSFVSYTLYLGAQPSSSLRQSGYVSSSLAAALLIGMIFFVHRGRLYKEDQVRPLYARHLAERLKLQAEISAAREAQTRLLPRHLPSMRGLSVAAAFRPAHEVGGDFYDLFPLGPDRVGIFFAEGGGRGLAAALSIAFAKGYLMPKLSGGTSPSEIVCRLQDRLSLMLESGEEMGGLAYAVIDASTRTLEYARAGAYPKILIGSDGMRDGVVIPVETGVSRTTAGSQQTGPAVVEAIHPLAKDEYVLLFTDGIGEAMGPDELWKEFCERRKSSPGDLYQALLDTVDAGHKRARNLGIMDDLTAIAVCLNPASVRAAEGTS